MSADIHTKKIDLKVTVKINIEFKDLYSKKLNGSNI